MALEPGYRHGEILVVSFLGEGANGRSARRQYLCRSDCGREFVLTERALVEGSGKCAFCVNRTHGQNKGPTYASWKAMLARCRNPNIHNYANYGGRGITVCERWLSFGAFLADMGERPSRKHTIDRRKSAGNYEPDNCSWATSKEQHRNQRTNRFLTVDGVTKCVADWAVAVGINPQTINERLQSGWSDRDAVLGGDRAYSKARRTVTEDGLAKGAR
jgi:hypothetical protein